MTEGDARTWKSQFQANARKTTPYMLGTWDEFTKNLNSAFEPFDAPGDALEELKLLRRKDNHIEDHVATFRRLAQAANLDKDSSTVRDLFEETLDTPLLRKMYSRGAANVPKTIEDWYKQAIEEDNAKERLTRRITRRHEGKTDRSKDIKGKGSSPRQFTFIRKDPNVMDVDALSTEKREEAKKKDSVLDVESKDTSVETVQRRGKLYNQLNRPLLTTHQHTLQERWTRRNWKNFTTKQRKRVFD